MKYVEYTCVFLAGGTAYGILEMLWRGHTHWSMVLAGGAAFLILHMLNGRMRSRGLIIRCLIGALIITSVELTAGVIFNLWLGMGVWDYSAMKWNFFGQICPMFTAIWFLLCIPAFYLSRAIGEYFVLINNKERGT